MVTPFRKLELQILCHSSPKNGLSQGRPATDKERVRLWNSWFGERADPRTADLNSACQECCYRFEMSAALRLLANSSIILRLNAGMSAGFRLVINPSSTVTS
jgi:hypothetical protein